MENFLKDKIRRKTRFSGLREVLKGLSKQLLADFESSSTIVHSGDKGEERETFFKNFLDSGHFPNKYSISKGHSMVISNKGEVSKQSDLIVYDGYNCPVLRDGENHQYFPIESVYSVIEVKSKLSKEKLIEAAKNIASVKRMAKYKTITRRKSYFSGVEMAVGDIQPIPFGAIFAYSLDNNSLKSLEKNLLEYNLKTDPNEWVNMICVLNEGIFYNMFNAKRVFDSRKIIELAKDQNLYYHINVLHSGEDSLLNFYFGLIGALGKMELSPPPLEEYIDLPFITSKGVSHKVASPIAALKCEKHGLYEPIITDKWVHRLAGFLETNPTLYEPIQYLSAQFSNNGPIKCEGFDINDYMRSAYIYVEGNKDPLESIRVTMVDGRPILNHCEVEVDGKYIILPMCFIDDENPLFESCPEC